MEDAIKKSMFLSVAGLVFAAGADVTAILLSGFGTAVDALLAVQEMVYGKGELSLQGLGELMSQDWKGREDLRTRILRSKRKWGNNDTEGVTALISTLGSLDSRDFPGDFPLDVMLLPHAVSGDKGLEVMKALAFQYYENGGLIIQFNVFDAEEIACRSEW